jgi:hypothetical protein
MLTFALPAAFQGQRRERTRGREDVVWEGGAVRSATATPPSAAFVRRIEGGFWEVRLSCQLAPCSRARSRSSQVLRVAVMISTPMAGPTKYSPTSAPPIRNAMAPKTRTAKHPSDT